MAKIKSVHDAPAAAPIAELFGLGGVFKEGGFKITGPKGTQKGGYEDQFSATLFTPEAYQEMIDYLTGPQIGALGEMVRSGIATPDVLGGAFGDWQETAGATRESLMEGLTSGYRTDVSPLVAEMQRQYYQDIMPQTIEDFIGTSGIASSDFGRALAGGGQDLATRIGALQYEADEAAAARQMEITQLAPQLTGMMLATPGAYASDLASLDEMLLEQESGGAKLWEAFTGLGGMETGAQTFVEPGGPSKTAQRMGAVGSLLSELNPA